ERDCGDHCRRHVEPDDRHRRGDGGRGSSQLRSRPRSGECARMAIYELDGQKPEMPADGRYWIADTATVIGRVRLLTDASIWFGSVLHGDPGFPVVIGRDCVIGHNVILHGAKVGDNSLIGMGAILLNGATIGKNSL